MRPGLFNLLQSHKTAASRLRSAFRVVPDAEGFSAFVGNKPVGFMKLRPSLDGTGVAQVQKSELDPSFRGMGLGRKMYGEVMRRLPEGKLESGAIVSPSAHGVWKKMEANPSYSVNRNPGAVVQGPPGKEEIRAGRNHFMEQQDRKAEGLPRLPDSLYTGTITSRALIKTSGIKVQPKHQEFLDEHFGVDPKWKKFRAKLRSPSFVDAVKADTRADKKLQRYSDGNGKHLQARGVPTFPVPSQSSGSKTYDVKYHPDIDRFTCNCGDWIHKRSWRQGQQTRDCKHIWLVKNELKNQGVSSEDLTKQAAAGAAAVRLLNSVDKTAARAGARLVAQAWKQNPNEAVSLASRLGAGGAFKDSLLGSQFLRGSDAVLGKGSEGVARPVLGPRGIDVRKHYFPRGPFASKKMQGLKAQMMSSGHPDVAALHQSGQIPVGDTIHRVEYVPPTSQITNRTSQDAQLDGFGKVLGPGHREQWDDFRTSLEGRGFSDVTPLNAQVSNGKLKLVDFVPSQFYNKTPNDLRTTKSPLPTSAEMQERLSMKPSILQRVGRWFRG